MVGVEAAGCPALVLHPVPSGRAEAFPAQRQRPCPDDIGASVTRGSLAQQMRAERMAWAGRPCRRGQRPLIEVVSSPPFRPTVPAAGEYPRPPSPAAVPACRRYTEQALIYESSKRPAE